MSIFSFVIRRKGNDILILSLHRGFRIFFLGFAAYLTSVLIFDSVSTDSNTGPIIFIVLSLISGCYYEAWTFDRSKQKILKHHGLLFLFKRKPFPLDSLDSIGIDSFTKGRLRSNPLQANDPKNGFFQKETCKLYIMLKNGERMDIEMMNARHLDGLRKKAEILAAFCEKPFALNE